MLRSKKNKDAKVFIGSDKNDIEQSIRTLLDFYPISSVVFWDNISTIPLDQLLIGTSREKIKYYDTRNVLIIDLDNNVATGGESNAFCARLIQDTKKMFNKVMDDIKSGRFAREWMSERQSGLTGFTKLVKQSLAHPINEAEENVHKMLKKSDG